MLRRFSKRISTFLTTLVVCILALVIIALGGQLLSVVLVTSLPENVYAIRLWTQLYYVLAGMTWLVLTFLVDYKLSQAAQKGRLLRRSFDLVGICLLVIGLLQIALTAYGYLPRTALHIALMALELGVGAVLIFYGSRRKRQFAQ